MGKKLYVGNLPYTVRDNDLETAFKAFGDVTSAKVMMERDTGRSKGFGFVEMGTDEQAQAAIQGMHGQSLSGRALVVNEARPMTDRPPRTGGFGGGRREGGFGGGREGGFGGGREGGFGGGRGQFGSGRREGGFGGGRGGDSY
jgi:RNA recognition motif-containing protein